MYVAMLDTGGIKYSGREIIALAETRDEARTIAAQRLLADGPRDTGYGDTLSTVAQVLDYYGCQCWGPIEVGQATEDKT